MAANITEQTLYNVRLHSPKDRKTGMRLDLIREATRDYILALNSLITEDTREWAMACRAIEDACQYAIASVVRHQ